MTEVKLQKGERLDDLQNSFYIIQSPDDFCFGTDAVLLSDFARIRKGDRVLDLGCGSGILPILLAAKTEGSEFIGLEIREKSAALAVRSIAFNHLEDRIRIVTGDIKNAAEIFGEGSFRAVVSNPPYMRAGHGLAGRDEAKTIARHEVLCTIDDIAAQSAKLLVSGGRLFLVHRPERLAEILCTLCAHHLEPKRLRFVHPLADREPNLVLIEALKGGRRGMRVEKPLILQDASGSESEELRQIYGRA